LLFRYHQSLRQQYVSSPRTESTLPLPLSHYQTFLIAFPYASARVAPTMSTPLSPPFRIGLSGVLGPRLLDNRSPFSIASYFPILMAAHYYANLSPPTTRCVARALLPIFPPPPRRNHVECRKNECRRCARADPFCPSLGRHSPPLSFVVPAPHSNQV